jgi:hypothetical protein
MGMGGASYVVVAGQFFSTVRREGETLPICWPLSTGLRVFVQPLPAIG